MLFDHTKVNGIVFGAFDLLHPGHLILLNNAKLYCDSLVVGLHIDPSKERKEKNRPVETVYERMIRLDSCKFVDSVIPYETEEDLINILKSYPWTYRFLGQEYMHIKCTGQQYCDDTGIKIQYIPRQHDYSSSNLRARIKAIKAK